jgi:hypothetical protein
MSPRGMSPKGRSYEKSQIDKKSQYKNKYYKNDNSVPDIVLLDNSITMPSFNNLYADNQKVYKTDDQLKNKYKQKYKNKYKYDNKNIANSTTTIILSNDLSSMSPFQRSSNEGQYNDKSKSQIESELKNKYKEKYKNKYKDQNITKPTTNILSDDLSSMSQSKSSSSFRSPMIIDKNGNIRNNIKLKTLKMENQGIPSNQNINLQNIY